MSADLLPQTGPISRALNSYINIYRSNGGTLTSLANECGLRPEILTRIESGERETLSLSSACAIAQVANLSYFLLRSHQLYDIFLPIFVNLRSQTGSPANIADRFLVSVHHFLFKALPVLQVALGVTWRELASSGYFSVDKSALTKFVGGKKSLSLEIADRIFERFQIHVQAINSEEEEGSGWIEGLNRAQKKYLYFVKFFTKRYLGVLISISSTRSATLRDRITCSSVLRTYLVG